MQPKGLTDLSDAQLMHLIRKDNDLAFSILYERYWEDLLGSAFSVLKEKEAAQDVVQEVFIEIWKRRFELSIENIQAYFRKATRYKVISHLRKCKSQQELSTIVSLARNTTEEDIDFHELKAIVDKSVEELPVKCKKIFRMSRDEQMSSKQIAEELNLSVRTVDNQIGNALKYLKSSVGRLSILLTLIWP